MPHVLGILETALYVRDPQRSAEFYRGVLDLPTLLESDRLIALSVAGSGVLLLFRQGDTSSPVSTAGGMIPGHDATGTIHFAMSIAASDVPAWREHLAACGVELESEVLWPGDVLSLYFRDPDGHLVELMTPGFWHRS